MEKHEMRVDAALIREERKKRAWSQEQLALVGGLGLRTVQRIESTGLASYESARAIASVYEMDVADFSAQTRVPAEETAVTEAPPEPPEKDKASREWKARPAWVRALFLGSGFVLMSRQQLRMLEKLENIAGGLTGVLGLCSLFGLFLPRTASPLLFLSALLFTAAYLASIHIRIGDEYAVWPWLRPLPRRNPARLAFSAACFLFLSLPLWAQEAVEWRDPHDTMLVSVEDGIQLEVLDWGGSGRALVLLTGLGDTAHGFDDFAPPVRPEAEIRQRRTVNADGTIGEERLPPGHVMQGIMATFGRLLFGGTEWKEQ